MPTLGPVFEPLPEDPDDRDAVVELREELQDQLDRGATHAFSPSFGLGALLALRGADPDRAGEEAGPVSDERGTAGTLLILGAIAASLVLVARLSGGRRRQLRAGQDPGPVQAPRLDATPKASRRSSSSSPSRRSTGPPASSGVSRETLARALATQSAAKNSPSATTSTTPSWRARSAPACCAR